MPLKPQSLPFFCCFFLSGRYEWVWFLVSHQGLILFIYFLESCVGFRAKNNNLLGGFLGLKFGGVDLNWCLIGGFFFSFFFWCGVRFVLRSGYVIYALLEWF